METPTTGPNARLGRLWAASASMRRVLTVLEEVAATDTTVLITGETGTGKELAAEAIHGASRRKDASYVVVDCAGMPKELIESELFGHVRGAFTGAAGDCPGAFEAAAGGTVFIDEIGELPLDLQPRLLRVWQGWVDPAGGFERAPPSRRADHRRDPSRSGVRGPAGDLPRRPVFQAQRGARADPAAPRSPRGHRALGPQLSGGG